MIKELVRIQVASSHVMPSSDGIIVVATNVVFWSSRLTSSVPESVQDIDEVITLCDNSVKFIYILVSYHHIPFRRLDAYCA